MKKITVNMTDDEAMTLLWALSIVRAKETKHLLNKGITPSETRIIKNLDSISRNVNAVLTDVTMM